MEESDACRLMDDAGIQYLKVKKIPPSRRYALLAAQDRITMLGESKLAELQAAHPFSAELTEKFFQMGESAKSAIVRELERLLTRLDIGHMIIASDDRQFFGFSLSVFLQQDTSVINFLIGCNKVKEARRLVETQTYALIRRLHDTGTEEMTRMNDLNEDRHGRQSSFKSDKTAKRSEQYMKSKQDNDAWNLLHKARGVASMSGCLSEQYCIALHNGILPYEIYAGPAKAIAVKELDEAIFKTSAKFDKAETENLREFVLTPEVLDIPRLPERLSMVFDVAHAFMGKLNHAGESRIGVYYDYEIPDYQLIAIEYMAANASGNQCIKWTRALVSAIIEKDADILGIFVINVVPA